MKNRIKLLHILFFCLMMLFQFSGCKKIKRHTFDRSLFMHYNNLKRYYQVNNFKLGGSYNLADESSYAHGGTGGVTLESLGAGPLRTAYVTAGTPIRNNNGEIINAIVVCTYWVGDATFSYSMFSVGRAGGKDTSSGLMGPNSLINTKKNFIIFVDDLGLWGASRPSDSLGIKFPQYTALDMVQVNYRLLKDKFNVAKVKLVTGVSMGANLSYVWALLHPDYVEAIMPAGGLLSINPSTGWLFQLSKAALESDPVWRSTKGDYYHLPKEQHPKMGIVFAWSVLRFASEDPLTRYKKGWNTALREIFSWDLKKGQCELMLKSSQLYDFNDLLYRYDAFLLLAPLQLEKKFNKIKAKTIILHIKNDRWAPYDLVALEAKQLKDVVQFVTHDEHGHLGSFETIFYFQKQLLPIFTQLRIH